MIIPTDNEIDALTEQEFEALLNEVSKKKLITAEIVKIDTNISDRNLADDMK